MTKIIYKIAIAVFLFSSLTFSQRLGKIVEDTTKVSFPANMSGLHLIFSDGGFGVGFIYERDFGNDLKGFFNLKISEEKAPKEFERYDYWGRPIVFGKVNRVFTIPFYFGINKRFFSDSMTDNLRPFVVAAASPTLVVTSEYNTDILKGFDKAKAHFGVSGTIGFGADFGLSTTNLIGISFQYHYTHLLNGNGVETLSNIYEKDFGSFFLMLRIGWMY